MKQTHLEQIKLRCLWLQLLVYQSLQQLAQQGPLAFTHKRLLADDVGHHHLCAHVAAVRLYHAPAVIMLVFSAAGMWVPHLQVCVLSQVQQIYGFLLNKATDFILENDPWWIVAQHKLLQLCCPHCCFDVLSLLLSCRLSTQENAMPRKESYPAHEVKEVVTCCLKAVLYSLYRLGTCCPPKLKACGLRKR